MPITRSWGYNQLTSISSAVGLANNTSTATALVVNAGGTGYAIGDILKLSGGTGLAAQLYVTAVNAGVVTGVSLTYGAAPIQAGLYVTGSTPGTTAVATTAVSSSGSGLTLNVTYGTTNTVPPSATMALIFAEAQNLRWRDDGVAPTSTVGNLIASGTSYLYQGNLANVQVIQATSGSIANVQFLSY